MALLTILAAKPDLSNEQLAQANGVNATGDDDTGFIEAVEKRFVASATLLARAGSMREINGWTHDPANAAKLAAAEVAKNLDVQIVGHGTGGQLALGLTWLKGDQTPGVARQFPYFVLDTNPASLQLLRPYIGKLRKLSLIGCNVGSSEYFVDCPVNGRALTYVLCELLQCDVFASVNVVALTDFDEKTGEFAGAVTGWTWNAGTPVLVPAPPAVPYVPQAGDVPKPFEIDQIHHASFSHRQPGPRPITNARAMAVKIRNDQLRWATPEITVNVKDHGLGRLISNARYLVMGNEQYAVANHDELYNALREPFLG